MSKVRKSILLSFGQNYVSFILQFFSSIILSRLLTPAQIGIFSVAAVLIGFAHTLRDFGSTTYVIQEKELTPEKIRSAFAMTIISAWFMAALIGLGSGYAATFYHEPGIRSVMLVLSINFFLIPFGSIPMAYMQRQMDFYHVALVNTLSNLTSTIATIGLAYFGFSYLSMAWGSVVGVVSTIVMMQIWRPAGLPFFPGLKEIRNVFSFGMLSNVIMILLDISKGGPDLIIGRLSNMVAVGYFGRAVALVSMFEKFVMKTLWNVALPHFSSQSGDRNAIRESFLHSMVYVTALAWPFFASLGIMAYPIVILLYGKQWEPVASLLKLLCLSSFLTSPFLFLGSIMTAIGQMKQNVNFLFIHVLILGLLVGVAAPRGLIALGEAFVVINLVDAVIYILQCRVILAVGFWEIARALRQSAGVAIASATPLMIMHFFAKGFFHDQLWLQLLLDVICGFSGWVCGVFLFKHPLKNEIANLLLMAKQARKAF